MKEHPLGMLGKGSLVGLPGKGNLNSRQGRYLEIGVAHCWIAEPKEHEKGKKAIQRRIIWSGVTEPSENQG